MQSAQFVLPYCVASKSTLSSNSSSSSSCIVVVVVRSKIGSFEAALRWAQSLIMVSNKSDKPIKAGFLQGCSSQVGIYKS